MISAILLSILLAMPGQQNVVQEADDVLPSRIEISSERTSYSVGEPINIAFGVYNDHDKPIRVILYLHHTDILYRRVDGQFIRYNPSRIARLRVSCGIPGAGIIPAHDKFGSVGPVFYNTGIEKLVLSEPGEYEFKLKIAIGLVTGEGQMFESNTIRVVVQSPLNEEQAALTSLGDVELAQLLEGDLTTDEEQKVERALGKALLFLETYPQSLYANFVLRQTIRTFTTYQGKMTPQLKSVYRQVKQIAEAAGLQYPE